MTWQAATTRFREAFASLRTRFSLRVVGRLAVGTTALALLAIATEAVVRARLDPPLARVPTGIYTRPIRWADRGERRSPILIGSIQEKLAEERIPVELKRVPKQLIDAVLAVEDQRFYRHHGLDIRRIGGALIANIQARRFAQGGSTITQQLAKNLFLTSERTPLRKLREWAMASVLEAEYDKATILESYLNEIYLGQAGSRALHGVGAAARYYFDKDVTRINLAESALLAGMIQAPNRHSPTRNERLARQRRNLVLRLMVEQERISRRAAEQAMRTRVGSRVYPAPSVDARYFRDMVKAELPARLPPRGAAVYTTLDADLQRAADRAVRDGLARLRSRDAQAALVALDPRTGEVLALVGGRDYGGSQFNRATAARRQPGSAFKPVVALAALEKDRDGVPAFTLASVVADEPLTVRAGSGGRRWEPSNFDRSFRGEVTFREALEQSLNVPFARIGLALGADRIVATARRLGISSPLQPVPSLALGSSEVTLLELVRAYGVFAAGGHLAATRTVLGGSTLGNHPPDREPPEVNRVADPAGAYLVTSALEGVIARGTGRALDADGRFGTLAGKTGTSNDLRDAWFVAYSPSVVVGVWVGFDDGRSLGLTGAGAALPIVARFLERAPLDDRWSSFPVPDGIEVARVGEGGWFFDCGKREVFLEGTAPDSDCGWGESPDWDREREHHREGRHGARSQRIVARLLERLIERDHSGDEGHEDPRRSSRFRLRYRE